MSVAKKAASSLKTTPKHDYVKETTFEQNSKIYNLMHCVALHDCDKRYYSEEVKE